MTLLRPPPSRIYLLRHAKSGWAAPGQRDFDRTLDDAGYAQAEEVAEHAADKGYRPDLVISSTAVRCRQTAEAIHRAFGQDLDIEFVDALYNGTIETYVDIIGAQLQRSSVMLIGHNPTMEEVLSILVGREASQSALPDGYPTAGLAVLDHAGDGVGDTDAHWTLTDTLTR